LPLFRKPPYKYRAGKEKEPDHRPACTGYELPSFYFLWDGAHNIIYIRLLLAYLAGFCSIMPRSFPSPGSISPAGRGNHSIGATPVGAGAGLSSICPIPVGAGISIQDLTRWLAGFLWLAAPRP